MSVPGSVPAYTHVSKPVMRIHTCMSVPGSVPAYTLVSKPVMRIHTCMSVLGSGSANTLVSKPVMHIRTNVCQCLDQYLPTHMSVNLSCTYAQMYVSARISTLLTPIHTHTRRNHVEQYLIYILSSRHTDAHTDLNGAPHTRYAHATHTYQLHPAAPHIHMHAHTYTHHHNTGIRTHVELLHTHSTPTITRTKPFLFSIYLSLSLCLCLCLCLCLSLSFTHTHTHQKCWLMK
jgi:hypothetical protein